MPNPERAAGRSAFGAEQKRVTLPMDFRSPPENGHSRYGHLTARFAPQPPFLKPPVRGMKRCDRAVQAASHRLFEKRDQICRPSPRPSERRDTSFTLTSNIYHHFDGILLAILTFEFCDKAADLLLNS